MILLVENNIRVGISCVMGDRYVESDENKKLLYIDANNLYGHSMSQRLPYDGTKFENYIRLNEMLNTLHDNDIGSFLKVDLCYLYNIIQKTRHFPFCPENNLYLGMFLMKRMKPKLCIT